VIRYLRIPESGTSCLRWDLKANSPIFKKALLNRLGLKQDFVIAESDLSLVISQIDDTDFAVETNLESFGLTREEAHKFVESALLVRAI